MTRVRAVSMAAAVTAVTFLVAACSAGGPSKPASSVSTTNEAQLGAPATAQPAPRVASAAMLFVSRAQVGEESVIDDPYFGGTVHVRLEEEYNSASGKTCRRFWVRPEDLGQPGQTFFACVVNGAWVVSGVY